MQHCDTVVGALINNGLLQDPATRTELSVAAWLQKAHHDCTYGVAVADSIDALLREIDDSVHQPALDGLGPKPDAANGPFRFAADVVFRAWLDQIVSTPASGGDLQASNGTGFTHHIHGVHLRHQRINNGIDMDARTASGSREHAAQEHVGPREQFDYGMPWDKIVLTPFRQLTSVLIHAIESVAYETKPFLNKTADASYNGRDGSAKFERPFLQACITDNNDAVRENAGRRLQKEIAKMMPDRAARLTAHIEDISYFDAKAYAPTKACSESDGSSESGISDFTIQVKIVGPANRYTELIQVPVNLKYAIWNEPINSTGKAGFELAMAGNAQKENRAKTIQRLRKTLESDARFKIPYLDYFFLVISKPDKEETAKGADLIGRASAFSLLSLATHQEPPLHANASQSFPHLQLHPRAADVKTADADTVYEARCALYEFVERFVMTDVTKITAACRYDVALNPGVELPLPYAKVLDRHGWMIDGKRIHPDDIARHRKRLADSEGEQHTPDVAGQEALFECIW